MSVLVARGGAALWAFLWLCVCPGTSMGDYYKYTDSSGTVCITNNKEAVPARYRAKAKVIRDDEVKDGGVGRHPGAGMAPAPETSTEIAEQATASLEETSYPGRLFARFPWMKPLFVGSSVIAGFFLVRRLAWFLPSVLLGRLVVLSFFLAVSVFGVKMYFEHISSSYFRIKDRVLAMLEKSNRREAPGNTERLPAGPPGERSAP